MTPEGWREGRFRDFITLQRGYDLPASERRNGETKVIASSGAVGVHDTSRVEGPGVVTGRSGTIGEVTYLEEDFWPLNTTLFVKDFHGNHPRYVYYFLQHFKLERYAYGTGVPTLNRNEVHPVRTFFPLLTEQRAIAEILGTWDQAIALVDRRIGTARQRKKGLMQRLLTGRVRFPEFAGEQWHTFRLGEVFDERRERDCEELPLLSVTDDEGIIYRDELDRRDTSSSDKSGYLRVCEGDIAYNTMRMWQGRSGVSDYEGIVSPAYTVCEPKPAIDVDFAGYLFQLPSVVYKFRRYSQGMVSDTWTLRFDNFAAIEVQIPGLEEQKRIAAVLQTCDREIELLEQKRDALQHQKKGLMHRLLTGRVRVSV